MNKTDKFLYGSFAAVAFAGLATMLASVFSPLKQTAEETRQDAKNRATNARSSCGS